MEVQIKSLLRLVTLPLICHVISIFTVTILESKKLAFTSLLLLIKWYLFIKYTFFILFFISHDKKRFFRKLIDINCWLLANNCTSKKIDLSFMDCHYFQIVKTIRVWQQELLNSKIVFIFEGILLAITIF